MIQFNLLPDVKLEYVKAQRTKNVVISASMIAAGSAFVIFLLLFLSVNVLQKKNIDDLTGDIKKYSAQLQGTQDLDKILTIQNQLRALPKLHADKAATGRTFKYIQQITPLSISISQLEVDYAANTIAISGQSDTLDKVNVYTDTLKNTKYTSTTDKGKYAFSNVVWTQFARGSEGATFIITAKYAPAIFDNTDTKVVLNVPSGVTTRSVVDQPTAIFKQAIKTDK